MSKKVSRIIGLIMLVIAICFVYYALGHPEGNFPFSGEVTITIYVVYIIAMITFLIAPFKKK